MFGGGAVLSSEAKSPIHDVMRYRGTSPKSEANSKDVRKIFFLVSVTVNGKLCREICLNSKFTQRRNRKMRRHASTHS